MQLTVDLTKPEQRAMGIELIQLAGDAWMRANGHLMEPVEVPNDEPAADSAEPVSPTVDPIAGVELDANGTPWIAEVHAGTKTKTVKGVWKAKRGVEANVLSTAEANARAKISATPEPVVPTEPVVAPDQEMQPVITMQDVADVWNEAVSHGLASMDGALAMYAEIGVKPELLNTDESMRATLYNHLKGLLTPNVGLPGVF